MENNIFDYLENLRRESYVKSVIRASESDDVIGYIGSKIPVEIFFSMGLMAIPVYGVDAEILKFSREKNLCSVIDATLTYAVTDKCPLIHGSKIIILENFCPLMTKKLASINKVYVYDFNNENLISKLENIYSRRFNEKYLYYAKSQLEKISLMIERLKYHSDLTGKQIFILEYYLKFLDLDEQIKILNDISEKVNFADNDTRNFLDVKIQNGAGIYNQIDEFYKGVNYRIIENFCNNQVNYDFVYENCPYCLGVKKISYK